MRQKTATCREPAAGGESVLDSLRRGLEWHRAGRLAEAEAEYKGVLERAPQQSDALHLMGLAARDGGRPEEALGWIAAAIRARADVAAYHNNLGLVLAALGRHRDACLCYAQALALQPGYLEAHINFGNALQSLGEAAGAIDQYRQALQADANSAGARNNLANVLAAAGRTEEAEGWLRSALAIEPSYAEAWLNLSAVLKQQDRLEEGVECCRRAIRLAPDLGEAFSNLGALLAEGGDPEKAEAAAREALSRKPGLAEPLAVLAAVRQTQKRFAEAEAFARQALALRPDFGAGWNALANALSSQGKDGDAEACLQRALACDPRLAEAHYNLANLRRRQLRLEEAAAGYRRAIQMRPSYARAHWNLSLSLLLAGEFREGWEEFEWRWRKRDTPAPEFPAPAWDGSPLRGRTLLLWHEQGLGDTIQFVRYAERIVRDGGRVWLECPAKLAGLLRTAPGIDGIVEAGAARPAFDLHAPLGSLPRLFRTTVERIPARVPYLGVDESRREAWRQRLAGLRRPRVGLVWRGNPQHAEDRERSIEWKTLEPLGAVRGVSWFALQYGEQPGALGPAEVIDLGPETADFRDAAAAIEQMDLVISVDTALAHLAGALARPVWLLAAWVPDWRWMLGREDSPWYPTLRLFRQRRQGDWGEVVERAAVAVAQDFSKREGEFRYAL